MVITPLRPSRLLGTVFVLLHAAAGSTVFPLDIPLEAKVAMIVVIAASLADALWRYAYLRARFSIVELQISDRECAAVRMREHGWRDAQILGTSCVTPSLTAMNLRVQGFRLPRHVILVRDNLNADDFRKVRILLRWARHSAEAHS